MHDALNSLQRLQSVRTLRTRRVLQRCRAAADQAREACELERQRRETFEARARSARAEIARRCAQEPVQMTQLQRLLDFAATATYEARSCETRLRRLNIVLARAEEALSEAWEAFLACDRRERATRERAEEVMRRAHRAAENRADERALEAHLQRGAMEINAAAQGIEGAR
jgi:hypothetical protein